MLLPILGNAVVNAHGNDIVANVEIFLNVENRLRLPVVRFADELVVHEIPAFIVAAGETDQDARILPIVLGQFRCSAGVKQRQLRGRVRGAAGLQNKKGCERSDRMTEQ